MPDACPHCRSALKLQAHVSFPPQLIYLCEGCDKTVWVGTATGASRSPHAQPMAQQQQQIQIPAKEDDPDKP